MTHGTKEENFDKMWKLAKELHTYKRKHRWQIIQTAVLVACIIILVVAIVTGADDVIRSAMHKLLNSGKSLAK